MPGHDIVVVGASAGGVEALSLLVGALPADLDAAVFVVLHVPPNSASALPAILDRRGPLPVAHARDGEPIRPGRIYVAPPDHHLLLADGHGQLRLSRGPRENGHRPAVDALFRSAAAIYGARVVAVVLSGSLDDGTAGAVTVKRRGGTVLVQDPLEAFAPGMPSSAIAHAAVDEVGPVAALAAMVARLSTEAVPNPAVPVPRELAVEVGMGHLAADVLHADNRPGEPSGFSCPDCGGVLWTLDRTLDGGSPARFRCRVGHAWSAESLLDSQYVSLESSLWVALRSLEERSALSHRLRDAARARGHANSAKRYSEQAEVAEDAAERIRRFLLTETGDRWADAGEGSAGG